MTHKDKLGFDVAAGDYVVGGQIHNSELAIYRVRKCTAKMVVLGKLFVKTQRARDQKHRRYPADLIKLGDEQVKHLLMELMK